MEGLEGLEALGNAGAIPAIIFLTQVVKSRIPNFKYGTDVLAFALSFAFCFGWTFYYMTPESYFAWASLTGRGLFKWMIDQTIVAFATWLAASKVYDLGHGNKKRQAVVETTITTIATEKAKLEEEITKLKNGHGETDEQIQEDPIVSDKLREILEG